MWFLNRVVVVVSLRSVTFFLNSRTDELKWGKLVGEDKFGNKYYQNDAYFMGKRLISVVIRTGRAYSF